MHKLVEVEQARALMNVAKDWSVWRWLTEKKRVRAAADRAVDALSAAEAEVKAGWSDELKKAYAALSAKKQHQKVLTIAAPIQAAAHRVKEADDEAENARLDAEDTFEIAEKKLSASLAREGARKALESWDLREAAIRKAEAAKRVKPA